ncbi:Arylsulfatase [Lunatimonas lonarensis]|uniref:Arylsulfatase n=1 Tax=Lunatimonas lonarensis TaxID=1232681 RepID=R7ZTT2_9BACT|nr:arylsulfatase [Lunatimonas lonarensis]EON77448.1 Arylsulfatase [Lunatimonas lonarensis]
MNPACKLISVLLTFLFFPIFSVFSQSAISPNVILIITDDQGYGDLGYTGNPHVQTPVLDALAGESVRLNQFYVSPVCAPTRSSLMTGRYSLRTGVRDTYNGGATMASDEVTIAEMLKEAGYRTGIFGKWHLGDNYPYRPSEQGFDESLIHLAGGMGQPGDFTTFFQGDRSYFDPVLWQNNQQKPFEGYCTDIFTEEAIRFIEAQADSPFFCYVSFNAPHTPLQVPDEYYERYREIDPSSGWEGEELPFSLMSEKDKEDARRVYAMVSNIDDNVGRLLQALDDLNIADNTVFIFMTDNGPQQRRYNGGMRGLKGTVFRGGVRVPFLMRMPGMERRPVDIDQTLAHIDVLPTLAEITGARVPADRVVDGRSFLSLIDGKGDPVFDTRSLFFYWTRKYPEPYQNMALQQGSLRLVGNAGFDAVPGDFALFDIEEDPFEQDDLRARNPILTAKMKVDLDNLLEELTNSPNFKKEHPIGIGTVYENPVFLNRNDAGGQRGIWTQDEVFGLWKVKITEGVYTFRFRFLHPLEHPGRMNVELGSRVLQKEHTILGEDTIIWERVRLSGEECDLIPFFAGGGKNILPLWIEVERTDL